MKSLKKNKILRLLTCFCLVAIMTMAIAIPAFGVSLAASFSGGVYHTPGEIKPPWGQYYNKSSYAQTVGYSGYHYVRAYVGGTSSNPAGAWADTGRCIGYGDIKRTCTTPRQLLYTGQSLWEIFPTAYAKYGQ